MWWLWKCRNGCEFEGTSPSINVMLQDIQDDAKLWCMAGAKGLSRACGQLAIIVMLVVVIGCGLVAPGDCWSTCN